MPIYDRICNYLEANFINKLWQCSGNNLPKKDCDIVEKKMIPSIELCKSKEFIKEYPNSEDTLDEIELNSFYN